MELRLEAFHPAILIGIFNLFSLVCGTYRYYQTPLAYGTGDTIIQTFRSHGGTVLPLKKWNAECNDGEALVGVSDFTDDFIRVQQLWCKFTFPLKPPTNGLYPYYQRCHVRNITDTFHCYDPLRHNLTSDTFMTALQSSNLNFNSYRLTGIDLVSPYKCCKTPPGYYIDYVSCYYMPTHDAYFEYYDSPNNFIVYCSQGYVMTGMAKKINPFTGEWRHDWIQCCRVGFGTPRQAHPPPVSYMPSGVPAYRSDISEGSGAIPAAYQPQYRTTSKEADDIDGSRPRRKDLISAGLFGQEEEERLSIVKTDPRRPTLKRLIANGVSL